MSGRFQKSKQEIQDMTEDEFILFMDDWNRHTESKRQKLYEAANIPHFSSVDEIKEYYNGLTLDELEEKLIRSGNFDI